MGSRFASLLLALAASVLLLAAAPPARAEQPLPSLEDVLTSVGFDAAAARNARGGQIVSRSVEVSGRSEIGAAVAMLVRQPLDAIYPRLQGGGFGELDPSVLAHGRIQTPATAASFAGLRIPPTELARLAQAAPGSDLNLAEDEIAALRAAAAQGQEAVGDAFRTLLAARVEAYRSRGLAGIAPYARGGGNVTSPADALRAALQAATLLPRFAPGVERALARYPQDVPPGFEDSFFWALLQVQDRPAVVLIHRLVGKDGGIAAVTERQFYVSQGFNALQILVGFFPVAAPDGASGQATAVVYTNRTSSDQAARFGRMAQGMGRRMLVGEVTRWFEAARQAVGG